MSYGSMSIGKTYKIILQAALGVLAVAVLYPMFWHVSAGWWVLTAIETTLIAGVGITAGHHRISTHLKRFRNKAVEVFAIFHGGLALTGPMAAWKMLHVDHHIHADTDLDPQNPHDPKLLTDPLSKFKPNFLHVKEAMRPGSWTRWYYDHYFQVLGGYGLLLLLIGLATGTDIKPLLFGWLLPAVLTIGASVGSVYMGHDRPKGWGYRLHDTKDTSVNSPINSLFAFGDGWHNNHHRYPGRIYMGMRWWEFDIGGLFAILMSNDWKGGFQQMKEAHWDDFWNTLRGKSKYPILREKEGSGTWVDRHLWWLLYLLPPGYPYRQRTHPAVGISLREGLLMAHTVDSKVLLQRMEEAIKGATTFDKFEVVCDRSAEGMIPKGQYLRVEVKIPKNILDERTKILLGLV